MSSSITYDPQGSQGSWTSLLWGRSGSEKLLLKINESIVWNTIYTVKFIMSCVYGATNGIKRNVDTHFWNLLMVNLDRATLPGTPRLSFHRSSNSLLPMQSLPLSSVPWISSSTHGLPTFPSESFFHLIFLSAISHGFFWKLCRIRVVTALVILALPAFRLSENVAMIVSFWSGCSVFLSLWCVLLQAALHLRFEFAFSGKSPDWGQR